jgi:hypothetical protein
MARPDDLVVALMVDDRDRADEAWGRLTDAGIPASVITEPGIMGAYRHLVQVHRQNLDAAQRLLTDLAG